MENNRAIKTLRKAIQKNSDDIKNLKDRLKSKDPRPSIKIDNQEISIRKTIINPKFSNKTVLTDSTWNYVEIFLKDKKEKEALTYWHQAENFFKATENLDMISKPLTSYYCFLNATKALLTYKKINFDLKHGVSGKRLNGHILLQNERIKIQPKGVLSGLCQYFQESINSSGEEYSLKDIFYNIEYIHRAYNLTYKNQAELLIPIERIRFVYDKSRKEGWLEANLEPQYSNQSTLKKLTGFSIDRYYDNKDFYVIRRDKTFQWDAARNTPTTSSLNDFKRYYSNIRQRLRYIYSANKLWYIKRTDLSSGIIDKNPLILTFAAMHRLSELSRYEPNTLDMHLSKSSSWLISEFISKSIYQFIDIISSEITGDDFRITGFRT